MACVDMARWKVRQTLDAASGHLRQRLWWRGLGAADHGRCEKEAPQRLAESDRVHRDRLALLGPAILVPAGGVRYLLAPFIV
jgi:hypothetical protein